MPATTATSDIANFVDQLCSLLTTTQLTALKNCLSLLDQVPPQASLSIFSVIDQQIAKIDHQINQQLNLVLTQSNLQNLEASWRGLNYLVSQHHSNSNSKIRVLNVSWHEIARDLDKAFDFDQSALFRKIYSEHFGISGGHPFGVLIGDYYVQHKQTINHPTDDISVLSGLAQIAAAAFVPFICSATPAVFGINDFKEMRQFLNTADLFAQPEYLRWRIMAQLPDTRFIGITVPQVAYRKPYKNSEFTNPDYVPDLKKHTSWGNACYCVAAVLLQSFVETGWLSDITGDDFETSGGIVNNLPRIAYATDKSRLATKPPVNLSFLLTKVEQLNKLGFVALSSYHHTNKLIFYKMSSVHRDKMYDSVAANENINLAHMLPYIFCMSRIAHYIKIIFRNKVGVLTSSEKLQHFLVRWLAQYVNGNQEISPELKARYPLQEAKVSIQSILGRPGYYQCAVELKPHVRANNLAPVLSFTTNLIA